MRGCVVLGHERVCQGRNIRSICLDRGGSPVFKYELCMSE